MGEDFWRDCAAVEIVPDKVQGRPLLKDTRVPVDTVIEAVDLDMSPEEIASDYRLNLEDVKAVLSFYYSHTTPTLVP